MIGAANLSPITNLMVGTGAVSRYKLSRSQKFVKVQDLNCRQMRALPTEAERRWVSGCNNYYKFVMGAGAKAKSVTTVPAEALAKAGQLTHIVRVMRSYYFILLFIFLSNSFGYTVEDSLSILPYFCDIIPIKYPSESTTGEPLKPGIVLLDNSMVDIIKDPSIALTNFPS
jgi:hypothetical protein